METVVCQVSVPGSPAVTQTVLALVAFAAIVLGGELFTTGTEWIAERFDLDESTTGSVFSALATTLPETLIPVLAILQGSGASVGVGAILGGPITLTAFAPVLLGSTALVGAARGTRDRPVTVDPGQTSLDLRVFLVGFSLAAVAGFVSGPALGVAVGVGLLALYAWYLTRVLGHESGGGSVDPEPLELGQISDALGDSRRNSGEPDHGSQTTGDDGLARGDSTDPPTWLIVVQVGLAIGLLLVGADLFIDVVTWLAETVLQMPEAVVALLLAPLVSNVPENVDGIIWIHRGEDVLAVEQLTGTLAFQGTIIAALGVVFTPWNFDPVARSVDALLLTAVAISLGTGAVLFDRGRTARKSVRPQLLIGLGAAYALFVILVVTVTLFGVS